MSTVYSTKAPEKAFGRSSLGDVWVGGVMIHRALQVALCTTKPHSDAVFSRPVAASGHTADVILLDVAPEKRNVFYILTHKSNPAA